MLKDFLSEVNVYKLLTKYYKELDINSSEYTVLMQLFLMQENGEKSLKLQAISKRIGFSSEEISEIMNSLLVKGFIQIEIDYTKSGKKAEVYNLDSCIEKIENLKSKNSLNLNISFLQRINLELEELFNRSLTTIEFDILKSWTNEKEDIVEKAIKEAKKNNITNIKYIDRLIVSYKKSSDSKIELNKSIMKELEVMRDAIRK